MTIRAKFPALVLVPVPVSDDARAVLDTWFGAKDSPEFGHSQRKWFKKNAAFDAMLSARFSGLIDAALRGQLDEWATTPEGALALILLLDQFTRNIYRGTPHAFSGDAQALRLAEQMVSTKADLALPTPFHRAFVYMPFEHDETPASQRESVRLFGELALDDPDPELAKHFRYAQRHAEVIDRFGRFPHRNTLLSRETTADEHAWLKANGGF